MLTKYNVKFKTRHTHGLFLVAGQGISIYSILESSMWNIRDNFFEKYKLPVHLPKSNR